MNYIRVLVARWSRRDWLAVLVVALVAALLVGTALLVVTTGEQTTKLAAEFDSNGTITSYDSPAGARAGAGSEAVVLPLSTATNADGESTTAVGIPTAADGRFGLSLPPEGAVGPVTSEAMWTLDGEAATEQLAVTPGSDAGILPQTWVRVDAATVEAAGPASAIAIEATDDPTPDKGTPLVGVLAFLAGGASDMMSILWGGVAIAGVVVAVTIANVVQAVIADRERTIRVARATGATPRRVRLPLAARAGLLTGVGALFGYALGVIIPNIAVNIAISLGLPTTLTLQVTPRIALLLSGTLGVLVGVGLLSGYLTARAATMGSVVTHDTAPSGGHGQDTPDPVGELLQPTLLSPRTVLPATATLSAFAVIVLLVASLGGVGASFTTAGTTLAETEAAHPVNSNVPEGYVGVLDDSDIATSPEVLLFGHHNGESYLARGGNYEDFAAVTGADLLDGRAPTGSDEAVVGTHAAELLGVEPGEELVVGGSTERGIARVTVVGVYRTGGIDDNQVFLPLSTARHLSTVETGYVNIVRTSVSADTDPVVVSLDTPARVGPGKSLQVTATVWNPTDDAQEFGVPLTLDNERIDRIVSLEPQELTTVEFEATTLEPGQYTLAVGPFEQPLRVGQSPPATLTIPAELPPDTAVQVLVENASADATVTVANETVSVGEEGRAWLRTPSVGDSYEVVVRSGGETFSEPIQVTAEAGQRLVGSVAVEPSTPGVAVTPTATATLWNPWNRTVESTVSIEGPGTDSTEMVQLDPGEETELQLSLARRPAGRYTVSVAVDDGRTETATYRVTGDERLASALAAGGHYGGGGGLGNAIEYVVGNLSVLLAAMVGLTALTIVGAMSAVLSRAVRARRQTLAIYRATGASPRRIFRVVIADAVRIGAASAALAVVVALAVVAVFDAVGLLTAFGITLNPWPSVTILGLVFLGSLVLTVIGAIVSTRSVVRLSVRAVLRGSSG
ncbi:FtsX-like permease family protein [Halovenus rubra]|uniref:FtsX-like permease family protein n=2 Tax=Halovenus rubra TaxID=869890 RepID=A0ACC7DWQ0_9EURY|nr:FtsX-like permease family protein [Halovenus rubra]